MSATDTFEWYVSSNLNTSLPEVHRYVGEKRDTLLALRSEDERQRFVADMIEEASQGIGPHKPT
jgi:hypothetical protein